MVCRNLSKALSSFILVVFYVCLCTCTCDTVVEMPTSVDDYIENISAHYRNELQIIEAQLSQMETAFSKELLLVAFNQELAAKIARKIESRLRSTATLNVKSKLCIQHFIGNVTAENAGLQNKLRACVDTGKNSGKPLPDAARTHVRNARVQLTDLTNTDLVLCRKNNANNAAKLTDCAREKLKVREVNIQNMMKAAIKEIESSMCKADIIARTAQECSFFLMLESQTMLSEIITNINTCIGDRLLDIR